MQGADTVDSTRSSSPSAPPAPPSCGIQDLPPEILIKVWALANHVKQLDRFMRVCRHWHGHIFHSPTLWTNLDLLYAKDRSSRILPLLLPRSAQLPLTVACLCISDLFHTEVDELCAVLAPHLYRVQHLAILSQMHEQYHPVLEGLLCAPAPLLRTLDLSTGPAGGPAISGFPMQQASNEAWWTSIQITDDLLGGVPGQLRTVNTGSHVLPRTCPAFSTVTSLQMTIGSYNRDSLRHLFTVFPRLLSLSVDNCADVNCISHILPGHPLRFARLTSRHDVNNISWEGIVACGFTRLPTLQLRNFHPAVAAGASRDPAWTARSLSLDLGVSIAATFVPAAEADSKRVCHIILHSIQMLASAHLQPFMQNVRHLTLSLAACAPAHLMPDLDLPQVSTLALVCGRGHKDGHRCGTLLDPEIMRQCGRLTAPRLRTIHLLARQSRDRNVIPPTQLAQFLGRQNGIGSANDVRPVLKVGARVALVQDPEGLAALSQLVSKLDNTGV